METDPEFTGLLEYLRRVPGLDAAIGCGRAEDGNWWVKFSLQIDHPLAWNVVQEFGHVLNYISVGDRLPTIFMPVSPPPYMNGGPRDFLSWVIESTDSDFAPDRCREWLEGRLPRPVEDESMWLKEEEDDDDD